MSDNNDGHTPGPWTAAYRDPAHLGPFAHQIIGNHDSKPVVARVNAYTPENATKIGAGGDPVANAQLIAAAPELLEAAKAMAAYLNGDVKRVGYGADTSDGGEFRRRFALLKDAINKAEGRSDG